MAGRSRHAHGFTLIEILAVLLIIGVVIGVAFVVPRDSGPQQQMRAEALRLQMLLEQARERALMENRELGLALANSDSYLWLAWSEDEEKWQPLQELSFRHYRLPDGVVINNLEKERPSPSSESTSDDDGPKPTWILFTDMQITPLRVEFALQADSRHTAIVESDGIGPVQIP